MACKNITVKITETETFIELLEVIKEITMDERLDSEVIKEYADKINKIIESR